MDLALMCWISTAAYALHVMEEFSFDWKNWARGVLKLPVEWDMFYVTNSIVIVLGGWRRRRSLRVFPRWLLVLPRLC
jgi:hypothetical protein